MDKCQTVVLTPTSLCDASMAIAACRAGARGCLDLEWITDVGVARRQWQRLARHVDTGFGVKLGESGQPILDALLDEMPPHWEWALLSGGDHAELPGWIHRLKQADIEVLVEAVSMLEARRAIEAGADGIVLKGHESGGRVGEQTSFVLLQAWRQASLAFARPVPVWVQGGIGLNTSAACAAADVAGVVLDSQLLMTRESPLPAATRAWLRSCDGSETIIVGQRLGQTFRVAKRPGVSLAEQIQQASQQIENEIESPAERRQAWLRTVARFAMAPEAHGVFLAGQDICWASNLAERYITTAGIIEAINSRAAEQLASARQLQPLAPNSALAESHKTRYPIVQGPMTRVSDVAPFADAVAAAGGLPFLALALLRQAETEKLLDETSRLLGDRPWGVGLLGFLPPEIRKEQVAAIRKNPPPMALIAGGRPDQARELEQLGIPTYLHVPSPGLLRMFLKDGARRFVFEGRECGGHVGPRTSFVLWETMCELLLEHLGPSGRGDDLHIIFAGGIHDAFSAAMVSALAARLAARGVRVGALMGTAYLFTEEAVTSGAIVSRFQQEALGCEQTVLMETGPGHAIRCVRTPYFDVFEAEKKRLESEGASHEEIVKHLEWMNIGRLRVASKGVDRVRDEQGARLAELPADDQYERGMYMIGQVAALHDRVLTMAELHRQVSEASAQLLEQTALQADLVESSPAEKPCDIAVIGMSCYYPKSAGLHQYWHGILNSQYAVGEIPASHWDWRLYYDADPRAKDKIVSKWGGFLDDIPFDPLPYGITPASVKSIEPLQLILLEGVRHALDDAGYRDRPFNRDRTAAILGIGGGGSPLSVAYGFRASMPLIDVIPNMPVKSADVLHTCGERLPEWTEDSFPGFLFNVAVGRVANRFNFGGINMAIDAACASSLAAVYACTRELELGTADVAVAMGADTVQTPFAYMAFSKTHALSRRGRCSPFDAAADGIVLSEGIGVVVLKRLADAQRDGDRIYAVIKGVGASSDGKEKGLTCPNATGQLRALTRAYSKAGVSPAEVELIEAHGTGTVVGDQTEAAALAEVFTAAGADPQSCALGSVKSMIGHSKCAAGIAGLIKAVLALHHKVLPPTLVDTPNPKFNFDRSPLYLNTAPRPWVRGTGSPRRAGVSAFGFGGTNFHAVLEEYTGDFLDGAGPGMTDWPSELFIFRRDSAQKLSTALEQCRRALDGGAVPDLGALAASCWKASTADPSHPVVAIVAPSLDELAQRLNIALKALADNQTTLTDPRGVYLALEPANQAGRVAMLFPGQGSQYPNMLDQLGVVFGEVRQSFDQAEQTLSGRLPRPLGKYVYPASTFSPEAEAETRRQLAQTDVAQPALGAADTGMYRLLAEFGLQPDMLAGHSYGEYVALWAAGVFDDETLFRLSHARGRFICDSVAEQPGGMAAIEAEVDKVEAVLAGLDGVQVANINAPNQTVISGCDSALTEALARFEQHNIRGQRIPVSCAFHSPWVSAAAERLAEAIRRLDLQPVRGQVYANSTATLYPSDTAAVAELLAGHLTSPVRFVQQIEAMYAAGARVFVECGPQGVLTGLVKQILEGRPHVAVATDSKARPGLTQLCHAVGQLVVAGVAVNLDRLFRGRFETPFALDQLVRQTGPAPLKPNMWVVNSVRSRLVNAPEPLLLGQNRPDAPPAKPLPEKPVAAQSPPVVQSAAVPTKPSVPTQPTSAGLASPPSPPQEAPTMTSAAKHPASATGHSQANGSSHGTGHAAPFQFSAQQASDDAQVMARFQDVMARFLDTQRAVMLSYLGSPTESAMPLAPVPLPSAVVPQTPRHEATPATYEPAAAQAYEAGPSPNGNGVHGHHAAPTTAATAMPEPANTPAPEPSVEPAAESPAAGVAAAPTLTREWLAEQLIDLVSKRTGYPEDMLGLDLDLEGDLGIDSIKRVEILGSLTESLGDIGSAEDAQERLELERLTGLKTLRGIIDYLLEALADSSAGGSSAASVGAAAPSVASAPENSEPAVVGIQRALVRLVDAPLPTGGALTLARGVVVLTDDDRGIAREVADRMADFGQQTVFLRHLVGNGVADTGDAFHADLLDADSIGRALDRIRKQAGTIGGLIHLLPLSPLGDDGQTFERAQRDVKSLYLLARALESDLNAAAADGGAVLLAATSLDGCLGYEVGELSENYAAGHGGIIGFMKCVALELNDVLARAIDLDVRRPVSELASRLLGELSDQAGPLEVGYMGARRITWEPVAAPLSDEAGDAPRLTAGDTILITGGARGITAQIAQELARRYQPRLVIVGRSPLPTAEEPADTAALETAAEIKAALIARQQQAGADVAPAKIEAEYLRLMQDREIRGNLERLRSLGATVEYHAVDVRDAAAFGALIDRVQAEHGIDGVIHGAGVIEDKLLRDKTSESFDRVFNTKVASALTLARHLDPQRLKQFALFASIASRYGNRGQSDYAAANEVLSKLAATLDRRWPGRVFSVAWGPWAEVGMVSHLEKHLVARGLRLIGPDEGATRLADELDAGAKGETEVIIAGGAEHVVQPQRSRAMESATV